MSGLFSKPKTPKVPPPQPLARQTTSEVVDAGGRESLRRRLASGRASTILSLDQGKEDTRVSIARLLGQ